MGFHKKSKLKKLTLGDYIICFVVFVISILFLAPFIYVIGVSLTDPQVYFPFKLYLIPEKLSLATYEYILSNPSFMTAMKNTILITIVGTGLDLCVTYTFAYVLTKK